MVMRLLRLQNGDHLDQPTFHRRYEGMAEEFRAELVGGIVFVRGRTTASHGRCHLKLTSWLAAYEVETPGLEALSGVTTILGSTSELEPDGCLLVRAEYGGCTWEDADGYLNGAPEWIGEICAGPESIDLHRKLSDYQRAGVREYVVAALSSQEVSRFISRDGAFRLVPADSDGIFRSEVFPGLWLDPVALLKRDGKRVLAVLNQGLASPEHAAVVAKLAAKRSPKASG
jgi:hypothetical protein